MNSDAAGCRRTTGLVFASTLAGVVFFLLSPSLLLASDIFWAAPVAGDYATSANWNPAIVPGALDLARFNLGSAGYTVSLPIGVSSVLTTFVVQNDTVTFDGQQSQSAFQTYVGFSAGDVGNLTFANGTANSSATIGNQVGSSGSLTIDGNQGATWVGGTTTVGNEGTGTLRLINGGTMSSTSNVLGATATGVGELDIGGASPVTMLPSTYTGPLSITKGTGTVNITNGGLANITTLSAATTAGSTATINLQGAGTALHLANSATIGSSAAATLNVTGAGQVMADSTIVLAGNATGQATVQVSGLGSVVNATLASSSGSATIQVEAGGAIHSSSAVNLANGKGGVADATITGAGSTWTGTDFTLGGFGTGTMRVLAGGQATFSDGTTIAPQGVGQLTVSGSGSAWNTGHLGMATTGSATMTVEKAATVEVVNNVSMAGNSGSSAHLTVDGSGSTLTATELTVGVAGQATVDVTNGGVVTVAKDTDANGGQGSIRIAGSGSQLTTSTLSFGGLGSLTVEAAGTLSTGALRLGAYANTIADSALISGQGSQLNVSGDAQLGTGTKGSFVVNQGGIATIAGTTSIGVTNLPGSVSVDGDGSQLTSNVLSIGLGAQGTMSVSNGGTVTTNSIIVGSGGASSIKVSGSGSTISVGGDATIGNSRPGTVTIATGGSATISGVTALGENSTAAGALSIDGSGSTWTGNEQIVVGRNSPGTVNVTAGALLSTKAGSDPNGYSGILGADASASGSSVNVSGAGSRWEQDGTLIVGWRSQSALDINRGGIVTSAGGIVGLDGTATNQASISDPGSAWNIAGTLAVGGPSDRGVGQMTIQNQAVVTCAAGTIGTLEASQVRGAVTVTGDGSLWNIDTSLQVGANGNDASLVISSGGLVQVGNSVSSVGTIDVAGGGSLSIGAVPTSQEIAQFYLPLAAPPGSVQINPGASFQFLTVDGDVFNNGGLVALGAGRYAVNGSFHQSSGGTMHLTAVGSPFVTSGELNVTGDAFLSGTIDVQFVRPLAVGQTYHLVKAGGSLTTSALSYDFEGVPAGFAYTTLDSGGVLSLTVTRVPEPSTFLLAGLGMVVLGSREVHRRVKRARI